MKHAHRTIVGGPGTGKTTTLCNAVKEALAQQFSAQETLFLGFSGGSTQLAAKILKDYNINCPITTLPGICAGLIRAYYRQLGFNEPPRLIAGKERQGLLQTASAEVNEKMFPTEPGYEQAIERSVQKHMRQNNVVGIQDVCGVITSNFENKDISQYFAKIKLLVIDDAQDLSHSEWQLIKKLRVLGTQTILAGDANSSTIADAPSKKLLEDKTETVVKSFRCKSWVCRFFNQLSEFNPTRNPYSIDPASESQLSSQNFAIQVDDQNQQLQWIAKQTLNCLQTNPNVTVGIICRNTNESLQTAEYLNKAGIQMRLLRTRSRIESIQPTSERVIVTTPVDAKGLEFSAVIIPSAVEGIWPYYRENFTDARHQFLAAVGRAKSVLFFVVPNIMSGKTTKISRFIKEGNIPDLTVRGKI